MAYLYLLSLFSTPQEADAIEGDLCEERATIAARDGDREAARWYRRQMIGSIAQLAWAPFRQSPFAMIGLGFLMMATTWPLGWVTNRLAQTLVINLPIYEYIPAATFWQIAAVPPLMCVGFIPAIVMRRRAMSTALAMFFAMAFFVCVIDPALMLVLGRSRTLQFSIWFWVTRAIYALGIWGVLVLVSAAIGITLRRKLAIG